MQDIEFTIEKGKLFMLQCRVGKRNGVAAVRMAVDMYKEKLIDAETAIMRVGPNQLVELLLPMLDPKAETATPRHRQGSSGRSRRRQGPRGLHLEGRRGMGVDGREGHPRPRRDLARRCRRHAQGAGHPHQQGRHDLARGARRPRLGQVLHRRLRRYRDRATTASRSRPRRASSSRKATGSPSTAPRASSTRAACRWWTWTSSTTSRTPS